MAIGIFARCVEAMRMGSMFYGGDLIPQVDKIFDQALDYRSLSRIPGPDDGKFNQWYFLSPNLPGNLYSATARPAKLRFYNLFLLQLLSC